MDPNAEKSVVQYIESKKSGDIILPGVIHSRTGLSADAIYEILERNKAILRKTTRCTCHSCKKDYNGEEIPEKCPYCGTKYRSGGNLFVYEKR